MNTRGPSHDRARRSSSLYFLPTPVAVPAPLSTGRLYAALKSRSPIALLTARSPHVLPICNLLTGSDLCCFIRSAKHRFTISTTSSSNISMRCNWPMGISVSRIIQPLASSIRARSVGRRGEWASVISFHSSVRSVGLVPDRIVRHWHAIRVECLPAAVVPVSAPIVDIALVILRDRSTHHPPAVAQIRKADDVVHDERHEGRAAAVPVASILGAQAAEFTIEPVEGRAQYGVGALFHRGEAGRVERGQRGLFLHQDLMKFLGGVSGRLIAYMAVEYRVQSLLPHLIRGQLLLAEAHHSLLAQYQVLEVVDGHVRVLVAVTHSALGGSSHLPLQNQLYGVGIAIVDIVVVEDVHVETVERHGLSAITGGPPPVPIANPVTSLEVPSSGATVCVQPGVAHHASLAIHEATVRDRPCHGGRIRTPSKPDAARRRGGGGESVLL
mmetsp:Transcript_28931/g.69737  ORF Transcript_28931/g.69737 Transcript_28931/m.69737 type:complete len:441 (+) Transcript_28931:1059-2381(+)